MFMIYAPMAELVDATDSKSVELRFMSVRVGLGVPLKLNLSKGFRLFILFLKQTFCSVIDIDTILFI